MLWDGPGSPDSKVQGAYMGPTWGQQDPGGPHVPCYQDPLSGHCAKYDLISNKLKKIFNNQRNFKKACAISSVPVDSILKTKDLQFDNIVIIGGTVSCHYDNLQCRQWWHSVKLTVFCFQCIALLGGRTSADPVHIGSVLVNYSKGFTFH